MARYSKPCNTWLTASQHPIWEVVIPGRRGEAGPFVSAQEMHIGSSCLGINHYMSGGCMNHTQDGSVSCAGRGEGSAPGSWVASRGAAATCHCQACQLHHLSPEPAYGRSRRVDIEDEEGRSGFRGVGKCPEPPRCRSIGVVVTDTDRCARKCAGRTDGWQRRRRLVRAHSQDFTVIELHCLPFVVAKVQVQIFPATENLDN